MRQSKKYGAGKRRKQSVYRARIAYMDFQDWRRGMRCGKGGYGDVRADEKTDAEIIYEKETGAVVGNSHAVLSADGGSADVGLQY